MEIEIEGATLYQRSVGGGPTLLALHAIGLDHTHLSPYLDALGEVARVVYYDQRAHGRSTGGERVEGLTHEQWSDDADALRRALGVERVFLFGHSHGAFLALEHALRFPDRVAGLIVCGVAPAIDYPEVMMANAAARDPRLLEHVHRLMAQPLPDDEAVRDAWRTVLPLYFQSPDAATMDAFVQAIRFRAALFDLARSKLLPSYDVRERLGDIRVPTLVLSGAHDWVTPLEQGARRIHDGIAGSELLVFEQSGHFPFIEEPTRFADVVCSWIRRHA